MQITRLKVSNFKSFDDVDINLSQFNIIIGSNASGKSNFIQVFKFIQDCFNINVNSAISIQGGINAIRNVKADKKKTTFIEMTAKVDVPWITPIDLTPYVKMPNKKKMIALKINDATYSIDMEYYQRGNGIKNIKDHLLLNCTFNELVREKKGLKITENIIANAVIDFSGDWNRKTAIKFEYPETKFKELDLPPVKVEYLFPKIVKNLFSTYAEQSGLPQSGYITMLGLNNAFANSAVFDIDPKMIKKGVRLTGADHLEEDGSNIANLLRNIIEDKKESENFYIYVNEMLPSIKRIQTEDAGDKMVILKVNEKYFKDSSFFGPFLSDGTVNIFATIFALYYDDRSFIVLEEPERNLHPFLIRKLIEMIEDASDKKQIVVTTHNPLLLRYTKLENIILVSRDAGGVSHISRPFEKKKLDDFLLNEIGVDELMIQNTLEKNP